MSAITGHTASHPAIRAYAQRHGIAASSFRSDGRITISFDRRYRVLLRPGPDGRILVSARLLDLAMLPPAGLEDTLLRLATAAGGLLREHAPGLCIDPAEGALLLMELLPASVDLPALEEGLAEFVNVLAFWVRLSGREAGTAVASTGALH